VPLTPGIDGIAAILDELIRMGGQDLQPHQAAAIDAAAALVRHIPPGQ
jgi:hypothetical protein